jgi:hypothetical protein
MPGFHDDVSRSEKAARGLNNGKLQAVAPNKADISAHLYALFPPEFVAPYLDAWIEVAYDDPATGPNRSAIFSPFRLNEAAAFAEARNVEGCNIYIGPALRQGETAERWSSKR